MSWSSISLPDLLRVLPDDARARVLGGRFTRSFARTRRACKALRELHDSTVAHANFFLNKGTADAWQQGKVRSPLIKFSAACTSLDLLLGDEDARLVSLAFVGATAACRQRITRLKVECWRDYDIAPIVETLAARLPALEELEIEDSTYDVHATWGTVAHTQLTLCTIADFLPRLRRLVLPLPRSTALPGLGMLAACAQLCELTFSAGEWAEMDLTQASLEGLDQLQQLERLTLGRFCLRDGDEQLLTQLLTTRRPPNLLTLKLLGRTKPLLEVDFEGVGGFGLTAAGPPRRHALCGSRLFHQRCLRDAVRGPAGTCGAGGRGPAAAADRAGAAVRYLSLRKEWRPPQYVQPGDPLPRLVARSARWRPRPAGAGGTAADPADGPSSKAVQQGPQPPHQQQLQLGTATPEQVLLVAVDELAAEAVPAGGSRGKGAAGGRLVMLRGALPPRGAVQRRGETGSARAFTAAVIQRPAGGHSTNTADSVLRSRVFKVLSDMWARSQQGGTSDTGGGGSSSKEDALRQLLALDLSVRRLWRSVPISFRTASDGDLGTDASSGLSSDEDDDDDDDDLLW
ncbi:hypothetical protein HXX76_001678 [Chlamydomonas incerta]|uniref:Uncharacterized protein n=1 Tax=Chlamydomonas incerta TaxID=51695 RepID=A0A835WCN2_CHLIN|nr:hypothetical protein HXX76_001678 [Chlamydomonas incerta]|eukprot:KAG2444942.1 hypothetical protein HXX76_001678 [Chlamydomonas incerta]